jgi:hypothetical protein
LLVTPEPSSIVTPEKAEVQMTAVKCVANCQLLVQNGRSGDITGMPEHNEFRPLTVTTDKPQARNRATATIQDWILPLATLIVIFGDLTHCITLDPVSSTKF